MRAILCVLGCRSDSAALARRARAACRVYRPGDLVVACGGRAWSGLVEADALERLLVAGGVAPEAVIKERCSLDTRDNARFAAALLARRGEGKATVVTCTWHLPRALDLFRAAGLDVDGVGASPGAASKAVQVYWAAREALLTAKDRWRGVRLA